MSAPAKQTSRWGSFLQQAVAGVESRLDNILAEDEGPTTAKKPVPTPAALAAPKSENVSRTPSTNRTNDRLQERLARAMAAKNNAQKAEKADSLALSSGVPSRTESPANVGESPRQSMDTEPKNEVEAERIETLIPTDDTTKETPSIELLPAVKETSSPEHAQQIPNGLSAKPEDEASPRPSAESTRSSLPRASLESTNRPESLPRSSLDTAARKSLEASSATKSPDDVDARLAQLQSDFETSELQRQEEVHDYIERIDALQSKLQYLAKESAEAAKIAGTSAPAGSLEKRLASKDEQIALLMEEGQKLSKKELHQMTIIKKLRAKTQEDAKELAETKKKQEKAETDASLALDRFRRAQGSERQLGEKQKQIFQLQKDLDAARSEKSSKDSIIADLRKQLEDAAAQEKEAEANAANEALELEKKRVLELEENLANLSIEKSLAVERVQSQMKDLREKMDKEAERARMMELEAKSEQQMLESKLEVMRARAEEASSGTGGDAQAKLLRQIETLQSQYAVASENWQGIEASLVARATSLEKERDEAAKREADIRRKAREVTLKAKRNEEELEETRSQLPSFEQELAQQRSKLENLQKRAEDAEAALKAAKASFDREKKSWQAEVLQRVEEERQKWQEEAGSFVNSRAESPAASMRRGLTTEYLGLQNLQMRRASARSVNSDNPPTPTERILGRRPSAAPIGRTSGNATPPPQRQDSMQSFLRENGETHDTPPAHNEHDDFFEHVMSPASPRETLNDIISVSTAGAGPSVQLVERMSSAVRRLESEKAGTKEELARLAAQRDEARAEIVALMREVQVKRDQESRIAELEKELGVVNERYETTLEMLGEKSELVDELKSDIQDIKAMYRELVERTVK